MEDALRDRVDKFETKVGTDEDNGDDHDDDDGDDHGDDNSDDKIRCQDDQVDISCVESFLLYKGIDT